MTESVTFLCGNHDRIEIRSSKIHFCLDFPELKKLKYGIIAMLNQFGNLYHGPLSPDEFTNHYAHLRTEQIKNLLKLWGDSTEIDWESLASKKYQDYYDIKSVAFYLYMMRVSLQEKWRWPALLSYREKLHWENGNSRHIATGMTKSEPWNHMNFLYWQPQGNNYMPLNNPLKIENDHDFHSILDLEYNITDTEPKCFINTTYKEGKISFNWINNGTFHDDVTPETKSLFRDFQLWSCKYHRPKIKIYTEWPELVSDYHDVWDIEFIKTDADMFDAFRQGHVGFDHYAYHEHQFNTNNVDFVLWIHKKRSIDLGDFLCWMDLTHSVYLDQNLDFIMYRRCNKYKVKTIAVSHVEYKY